MRYANIIVNISHENVDRPFSYKVPPELQENCKPGTKVKVPFGQGSRLIEGYILELTDHVDYPDEKLKFIDSVLISQDDSESRLIELAWFIKEQYGSTMIAALKTVLPVKKTYRRKKKQDSVELPPVEDIVLNDEQQAVYDDFMADYDAGKSGICLIHGITGSGKTEVYIEMVRHVVETGRQAVVLIPEISLTYQTVGRFRKYFGDRVAFMNSTLAAGARYELCEKARNGELDVIIGPRSALFTPFPHIGIIIIDEEHESTYKSENVPKYHARELAIKLAEMHGAGLVLGSATPSVESYYHALKGDYKLYKLKNRAVGGSLPIVHTVDLRKELREGNRSIFSRKLTELLKDRLNKGEQAMLFLNRRGYAGFVSCRACGHVMKCPHCDVSLSEHRNVGKLVCHYCGYETERPHLCPECGSKYLLGFRAGTEQIEQELHKLFPGIRTLRMDADTTGTKDSYEKILSAFAKGEADVLVGTQMIVKGHDYSKVTLVGVVAADLSLASNDYRAGERTFQLITQAAGRAGRGSIPGEVVIQSYQPDHYSIVHASKQDYESFYDEEMAYREIGGYPPLKNVMAVLISGKNKQNSLLLAQSIKSRAEALGESTLIIGPGKAGIGKINDNYRFMLYMKNDDISELIKIKDDIENWLDERKTDIGVFFDFNPMSAY